MPIEITISLPEDLIEHAKRFRGVTHRGVEAVLSDALEMIWQRVRNRAGNRCEYCQCLESAARRVYLVRIFEQGRERDQVLRLIVDDQHGMPRARRKRVCFGQRG